MNIYSYTPPLKGEDFTTLLEDNGLKVSRIVSSNKVEGKLYIQKESEFVILLEGSATLEVDGKIVELKRGDTLHIAAKVPHKVLKTEQNTLWLAIYYNNKG